MKFSDHWARWSKIPFVLGSSVNQHTLPVPLQQSDQTLSVPWFLPALLPLVTFFITFVWVETALPLLIIATAMDRYRFDFGGAGLRIEHFVFVGVAAAWILKQLPVWRTRDSSLRGAPAASKQSQPDSIPQPHFGRQVGLYFTLSDLILAVYLGFALLSSILFAPQLRESLKFLGLMVYGFLLYILVRAIASDTSRFERGVRLLMITGVVASAFGILAWAVYPFGIDLGVQVYALGNFETHSPFGTLFDSNTLGMYAMAAALIQVTLLLDAQFAKWRGWLAIGIVLSLIAVALSLTRVAWLGLVFGLFLVLLFSPRQRWALAIGAGAVVLVILALLVNSALAGGSGALAEFSVARVLTSRSIFFRLDAYTRAWNDFLASPLLGNGVNVFAQKYTAPSGTRDWISNFFLMALNDTGLVGLVLLLAWLGWLAYTTWRTLKLAQGMRRTMLLGLSIAYLALFVTYQATTVFWLGFNWVYLGLIVGGQRTTYHE